MAEFSERISERVEALVRGGATIRVEFEDGQRLPDSPVWWLSYVPTSGDRPRRGGADNGRGDVAFVLADGSDREHIATVNGVEEGEDGEIIFHTSYETLTLEGAWFSERAMAALQTYSRNPPMTAEDGWRFSGA